VTTERFTLPEGYRFEIAPLFGGRGRIIATDGVFVDTFW
jgi:hypothetical protein